MPTLVEVIASTNSWLNIIVGLFIYIFGILGNCLNIYVFTRPVYRNTTSVMYLVAFSIASCIQILHTLSPRIISDGFLIPVVKSNTLYCQFRNTISSTASLCAISYPCWASFNQYISTSRNPILRIQWSSKRFTYHAIFATVLFWVIVFLPLGIFSQAISNNCTYSNSYISIIYTYVVNPIAYSVLPTILFTYFNISIINNLRVAPITVVSNTNKRLQRQVQRMLVSQLIILILSGSPFVIQSVYSVATISVSKEPNRIAIESLIGHITRFTFYLNFVSAFYIYVIMSKEFRKVVRKTFSKEVTIATHASIVVNPHA